MDIKDAIAILDSQITGLNNSIAGEQKLIESYTIARDQLSGILDVKLTELEEAKQTITSLQSDSIEKAGIEEVTPIKA